jgi:hypothetical protein
MVQKIVGQVMVCRLGRIMVTTRGLAASDLLRCDSSRHGFSTSRFFEKLSATSLASSAPS